MCACKCVCLCVCVCELVRILYHSYVIILILINNQPDALFHVFIYSFHLSTCFEHQVLIIRRSNFVNTSSGMISLCT